jgi:predicted ester cyclase
MLSRKEKEAMSTEENKKLVLRWKEEIWDKRNLNIIDELCAPDYVGHIAGFPGPDQGREVLKQAFGAYFAAFDIHDTREFLIAEGDMVAIHDTYWAKHTDEFQGIPSTGKETTFTGVDIYHIVDGKIVEQWFEADTTGALQRLGFLPTPGHSGR